MALNKVELAWVEKNRNILDVAIVEDIISFIWNDRSLTNSYPDETARLLILTNYLHRNPEKFAIRIYQTTNSCDLAIIKNGHIITECDCGFDRIPDDKIGSGLEIRAFVEKGLNNLGIPSDISHNIVKDAEIIVK